MSKQEVWLVIDPSGKPVAIANQTAPTSGLGSNQMLSGWGLARAVVEEVFVFGQSQTGNTHEIAGPR